MPIATLVEHPPNHRYLVLRQHYLAMFDGDHCAAAVVATFEYFSNGERDRLDRLRIDTDPWFVTSIPKISEHMLGLYCTKQIQKRVDFLISQGIVSARDEGPGKAKEYLFDYNVVNDFIASKRVIPYENHPGHLSNGPDPGQMSRVTLDKCPPYPGLLSGAYKEEERINNKKEEYTPPTPSQDQNQNPEAEPTVADWRSTEDLQLDDPVEVFVKNAYSRLRRIRFRFTSKQSGLRFRLAEAETATGKPLFRKAFLFWLADDDDWLKNNQWPLAHFLKHIGEYEATPAAQNRTRDPEAEPGCMALDKPEQDAREPPAALVAPRAANRDFVAEWNSLVPSCPVEWDQKQDQTLQMKLIILANTEPKFTAKFEEMCQKAEAIHKQQGEQAAWLTFRWLLREKDGTENWWKLASGEFNGMAAPKTAAQSKKFLTPFEQAREERKQERLKRENPNGAN